MQSKNVVVKSHTFVICAYKKSPFLEECIQSILKQSVKSNVLLATSTPNEYISKLAEKYGIEVRVNDGEKGITQDWNFALSQVKTKYATIAHQDDVYEPKYLELVMERIKRCKKPLIVFTDYCELRNGEKVAENTMLKVKRMMLLPLRIRCFENSKFVRRRVLSMGDPICCPSVTFCLENLELPIFQHGFRSCEDWEAWEKLSCLKGAFCYISEPLMCHRIHEESATTAIINDNARNKENYIMFCKFWPKWVARLINRFYAKSEKSNEL